MQLSKNNFCSPDGLNLRYHIYKNEQGDKKIKACLAVVHGYGEHGGRYQFLADYFLPRGYQIFTFDLRGHGESAGKRGHILSFSQYLEDVKFFLELVRDQIGPETPLILLGHSLGGLIVLRYCQKYDTSKLKGLICSSPFIGLSMKVPAYKVILGNLMSKILPGLTMPAGVPSKYLSHDPEVVKAYDSDPLVVKIATARWFTETVTNQQLAIEEAGKIGLPVLVMQAGADRVVDKEDSRRTFEQIGSKNKKWQEFDNFFHEIFNETGKEQVFELMEKWLEEQI